MLLLFINFLTELGFPISKVFYSLSFRMLCSSGLSLMMTVAFGKLFIRKLYELKVGHTIRVKDCAVLMASYQKSTDVPSMGGVLFLFSMACSSLIFLDFTHLLSWVYLLTLFFMASLGFIDDLKKMKKVGGLSGKKKLFFEALLGLFLVGVLFHQPVQTAVCQTLHVKPLHYKKLNHHTKKMESISLEEAFRSLYIPFVKRPLQFGLLGGFFLAALSIFVLCGTTNGVNLSDGLDGLAIGLSLFVSIVFGILSFLSNHIEMSSYLSMLYLEGSSEMGIFLASLIGGSLGFLWFNSFPAQVFMGDIGSITIGSLLGLSAIILRRELLLAVVGAMFVVETVSVILQVGSFRLRKKRIFLCTPIHHHFECKGWHEVKIVMRFWMLGLLFALIGLLSLKI